MHEFLNSHNWGPYYASFDVDTAWNYLYSIILSISNQLCPIKTFHIKRDRPPWFSDEITELSKNRDEFFKIGKKQNNQTLLNEARYLRNSLKHDINQLKNDYYLHLMTVNQENANKFWSTMNDILCINNKSEISVIKDPDTNLQLNPSDSVEVLNHYFLNVADVLVSKLPNFPEARNDLLEPSSSLKFDACITPEKIKSILREFSITKSSRCLQISSRLYLDSFEVLHEGLAFIMNLSLRTKTFPKTWKKSIVTPIPKKGDRCIVGNIRPISLIHIYMWKVIRKNC